MTAYDTMMGIELSGTAEELIAHYADGSGQYAQYLVNHGDRQFLITAQSAEDGDAFAVDLNRAPEFDTEFSDDDMLTERFGSMTDEEARTIVMIDGDAYITEWADDVVMADIDFPA